MIHLSHIRAAADGSSLWRFVRAAAARVGSAFAAWLEPPANPGDRDRAVERLVASSLAGRALGGALSAFERAWPASRLGRRARRLAAINGTATARQKICLLSLTTLAAAITAILLRPLSSRPEPLTWLLPTAFAVAALLVLAAAGRAGAASGHRNS